MNVYLWVLFGLTFIIFFRSDVMAFLSRFEQYPYLVIGVILCIISHFLLSNTNGILQFLNIVQHDIYALRIYVNQLVKRLLFISDSVWLSEFIFKFLVFGFFIFYPYYYKRKFSSRTYASEIISVNVIYSVLILFFLFFCARFNI